MRALQQAVRLALNLLLKLLRLILAAKLQLLDLALLLSGRFVEDFVPRLKLELTTKLVIVQLLLACCIGHDTNLANAGGCLVQLAANKGMRHRWKRDQCTLPGCPASIVQAHVKISALLLPLEQVAIDPVLGTTLRPRQST
jgi:hypothetical protein